MPVDYKYIDPEHKARKKPHFRIVLFFLILFSLFSILIYTWFFLTTRHVENMILTGQYTQARSRLHHWPWLPLVRSRVYELLGTAELLRTGGQNAVPYLSRATSKLFAPPSSFHQDVLKILWANGRYADGLIYSEYVQKKFSVPQLPFYKAGFLTGENRLQEASHEIANAPAIPQLQHEAELLKVEIDQRLNTGKYTILFDRKNFPLADRRLTGEPEIVFPGIESVLKNERHDFIAKYLKEKSAQAVLTLDYRIQNAAIRALDSYAGAIVVIDPQNGDILAAASKTKGLNSEYAPGTPLAFLQQYEPGSIVKLITLAAGLEEGVDMSKIFPLQCQGNMVLADHKILYDWKVHGHVKDFGFATAVSCNVAFARIGLAMKPADLLSHLRHFGFQSLLKDPLPMELGKIQDAEVTEEYLANLSIGLNYLRMTPLHAAMLAAAIANHGVAVQPRLLLHYRNLIGVPYRSQPIQEYEKWMSPKTADVLSQAMLQVVENPEGTGRRAAVEGFRFVLKTGTAGEGAKGYNAILIGFGPIPNPKIAFAVVLEHSGKAEFEGARVTRLFLESIQRYI